MGRIFTGICGANDSIGTRRPDKNSDTEDRTEELCLRGARLYIVPLLFAFATKSWMIFAFMIPYGLGGIVGPALQGIMWHRYGPMKR